MSLSSNFIKKLKKQYQQYLFKDFLPYMETHIMDEEEGGFLCHTDRDGYNVSTHKRIWYDGRGIWVCSQLYTYFGQNETYLQMAQKTVDLVLKLKPTDSAFWPDTYTKEGMPIFEKKGDIYGGLFVAEGLTAFSQIEGKSHYLKIAKEILFTAVAEYDKKTYHYEPHYSDGGLGIAAPRVLGHWMALLNISRQILAIDTDTKVEDISNRCIKALLEKHLQSDFNLMIEYLEHDFSVSSNDYAQFSYIGHAIETLWMMMEEAKRRKDTDLFSRVSSLFKRHVEVAWDDVFGGVFHCLNNVEDNNWLLDKVLWAQEEVMVGLMILVEEEDEWAERWLPKVWEYLQETFVLHNHPSKLWINGGDRRLKEHHQIDRFENYHHPRHLMFNFLRLEKLFSCHSERSATE